LNQKKEALPKKIILISPVMDAMMTNPDIKIIDEIDPMLSRKGILSSKKMCAENGDLEDERISPINGSFKGFPKTIIFVAENDIMYPDELLAIKKMQEAKTALNQLIERMKD